MLIAAIAFTAAVAGVWAGREVFPSSTTPGVELHRLLHDGLELDEAQRTKLQTLESRFAVRRRALLGWTAPNGIAMCQSECVA
ncbi:hypothetical protein MBESOW_P2122, partial [Sphingobium xenophagum]